jgi:hypothetical protein
MKRNMMNAELRRLTLMGSPLVEKSAIRRLFRALVMAT